MMNTLLDEHEKGKHLQEKQDDCLLCISRHMVNPSSSETLEIYRYIKEVLRSTELVSPSSRKSSVRYSYQLITNLDISLREKLFDEAIYGRTS